jgi:hypothetical protein
MSSCYHRVAVVIACVIVAAAPLAAQSGSSVVVRELTSRLAKAKLDSVAARVPETQDTFVAARFSPGEQLVVVSGRHAVPVLIREKIIRKQYRDAYLDVFAASDRSTRRVVDDLRADGLQPLRRKDGPFDTYTRRGGESIPFDGDWKGQKMSERFYMAAYHQADRTYADMLKVLILELDGATAVPSKNSSDVSGNLKP